MKMNMKKIVSVILAFAMLFAVAIPVFAVETETEEEETFNREKLDQLYTARFDTIVRQWLASSKKDEVEYVTAEDAMDCFEAILGYRPAYTEQRWYKGHFSLTVYFTHLSEQVDWDCEISNPTDNGWRMDKDEFEKLIEEMRPIYLTPEESEEEEYYTTDDVEELYYKEYGYDVHVYQCIYWQAIGECEVNFIVCDLYNGQEIEIDAVQLEDGEWYVTESEWQWFLENFDLSDEVQYATEDVEFWTYEEIVEEFTYMLGYTPDVSVGEEELDWFHTIDFSFDHLGGKKYSIDWVIIEEDGDILVTDKVFSEFLDENPEITVVPRFSMKQLQKMFEFYLKRILD